MLFFWQVYLQAVRLMAFRFFLLSPYPMKRQKSVSESSILLLVKDFKDSWDCTFIALFFWRQPTEIGGNSKIEVIFPPVDFYSPSNFCCLRDFAIDATDRHLKESFPRNGVNILISACWHLDCALFIVTLCNDMTWVLIRKVGIHVSFLVSSICEGWALSWFVLNVLISCIY